MIDKESQNELIEVVYKHLLNDAKTKVLSKQGKRLCMELKIEPETILQKRLDAFKAEFQDEDIASIHQKHHARCRVKNLIRIAHRILE